MKNRILRLTLLLLTPTLTRSILFSPVCCESVNHAENPTLDLSRSAATCSDATAGLTSPTPSRSQCTVSHVIHGCAHRCDGSPFPHPAPRFLYPLPLTCTPSPDSGHRIQDSTDPDAPAQVGQQIIGGTRRIQAQTLTSPPNPARRAADWLLVQPHPFHDGIPDDSSGTKQRRYRLYLSLHRSKV